MVSIRGRASREWKVSCWHGVSFWFLSTIDPAAVVSGEGFGTYFRATWLSGPWVPFLATQTSNYFLWYIKWLFILVAYMEVSVHVVLVAHSVSVSDYIKDVVHISITELPNVRAWCCFCGIYYDYQQLPHVSPSPRNTFLGFKTNYLHISALPDFVAGVLAPVSSGGYPSDSSATTGVKRSVLAWFSSAMISSVNTQGSPCKHASSILLTRWWWLFSSLCICNSQITPCWHSGIVNGFHSPMNRIHGAHSELLFAAVYSSSAPTCLTVWRLTLSNMGVLCTSVVVPTLWAPFSLESSYVFVVGPGLVIKIHPPLAKEDYGVSSVPVVFSSHSFRPTLGLSRRNFGRL